MKKNMRSLLILSGVLVVLVALWVTLALVPEPGSSGETSAATTQSQSVLFTIDPAEVARIAVHNNLST
jgi:hypothetical protein